MKQAVVVHVDGPIVSPAALDELRSFWQSLQRHHNDVAEYRALVRDPQASWERRRSWYRDLLEHGGAYFIARDDNDVAGYAMTQTTLGPDDTFDVRGGVVEIITLVVAEARRGHGVGRALTTAVREFAAGQGIGTLKVAVMVGNTRARSFYANVGFLPAEEVFYINFGEVAPD